MDRFNQNIPSVTPDPELRLLMNKNYEEYEKTFECKGYDRGWVYGNTRFSFTHYIYSLIEYYSINTVYEIGTFKGASVMMLMNYFLNHNKSSFYLHSIDSTNHMSLFNFSMKTIIRYLTFRKSIRFQLGDSTTNTLDSDYDLVIIDGSHKAKDVKADFDNVKCRAKFVLFDDLNYKNIFEKVYQPLLMSKSYDEIFRTYTSDPDLPHCIGLVRSIKN